MKEIGDFREYLQFLQCQCYIKFETTTKLVGDYEQGERRVKINHIKKGKRYLQLIRQIHSNACAFRFWKICQRMNLRTPVMRYNKQQFQEIIHSDQSNHSQLSSNSDFQSFYSSSIEHPEEQKIIEQSCLAQICNQIDPKVWQLKQELDQYCIKGKKVHKFLKKLDKIEKKDEFALMLKICCVCNQGFTQDDLRRLKCIQCLTQLHDHCSHGLERCFCQQQNTQLKRVFGEVQIQASYKIPTVSKKNLFKRKSFQGICIFRAKTNRQVIDNEEKNIKSALYARDKFIYTTSAKISDQFNIQIDLKYDPFLQYADQKLANAYRSYAEGQYKPPLKLRVYSEDSFGIEALEALPKFTLLGEYAADIIPAIYYPQIKWKDHLMIYYQGSTSKQELMLAPFNCCNFGPLLNHSQEGNCSSLRVIIDGSIRVLLFTIKRVKAGQELFYNYNGLHDQYPTEGFEKLID